MALSSEQIDKLTTLGNLRDSGTLTDSEYETEKAALLAPVPEPDFEAADRIVEANYAGVMARRETKYGLLLIVGIVAMIALQGVIFGGGGQLSKSELEDAMRKDFTSRAVGTGSGTVEDVMCVERGDGWNCIIEWSQLGSVNYDVAVDDDGSWVASPK